MQRVSLMFGRRNPNDDTENESKSNDSFSGGQPKSFMDFVQLHERTWGTERYSVRPGLGSIIQSPVVAFWQTQDPHRPYKITLHENTDAIEKHILRLVIGTRFQESKEKLAVIFQHHKRIGIAGFSIIFREID